MNSKDNGSGSAARAAREIGGRYEITRFDGGRTWYGEIQATTYRIDYAPGGSDTNRYPVHHPRGTPGTLAEAKRMAEEDHERRRREISK